MWRDTLLLCLRGSKLLVYSPLCLPFSRPVIEIERSPGCYGAFRHSLEVGFSGLLSDCVIRNSLDEPELAIRCGFSAYSH